MFMTQNPELFITSEAGAIIAANTAIKILKRQDRTSAGSVGARFQLTGSEAQILLGLSVQDALVIAGDRRVLMTITASASEHALITTNPLDRAGQPGTPAPITPTDNATRSEEEAAGSIV